MADKIAPLSNAPNEILGIIAEQLSNDGLKGSLASLSLTSKRVSQQVVSWLYRDIALDFSIYEVVWSARILNALLKNTPYRHYVRSLTVTCGNIQDQVDHLTPCFPVVAKLVGQLRTLQSFSWHAYGNIPCSVLEILHSHSNVNILDLQIYHCKQSDLCSRLLNCLEDLQRTPKLKAALLELSTANMVENDGVRRTSKDTTLNEAIIQAPCLETLTLRITPGMFQYANGDTSLLRQSPEDLQPQPEDNDFLQSLTNLKIHGPSAGLHESFLAAFPNYHLQHLELWACEDCSALLDILSNRNSIASNELRLRTLKIGSGSVSNHWAETLVGVEAIGSFLVSFEGLQELCLEGFAGVQTAAITWHHKTLRKLSLMGSLDFLAPDDPGVATHHRQPATRKEKAQKLSELSVCKNLRSLRINDDYVSLGRSIDDVAIALSRFRQLKLLTLVLAEARNERRDTESYVVMNRYSEVDVYNITRNVAAPNLLGLQITDEVRPIDDKVFVDVTEDHHNEEYRCNILWHVDCTKCPNQLKNMLLSSDAWQEKRVARLAKSMGVLYVSPDQPEGRMYLRNEMINDVLQLAHSRRQMAVKAMMAETIARRGVGRWTKLLDTLGYQNLDEF